MITIDDLTRGTTRLSQDGRTGTNGPASVTVDTPAVRPGEAITVEGSGWLPGSVVMIYLRSTPVLLGTSEVDEDGNLSTTVRVPSDIDPGAHELIMTGLDEDGLPRKVTIPITILATVSDASAGDPATGQGVAAAGAGPDRLAAVAVPRGPLAQTGGGLVTLAARGLVLLLLGVGLLRSTARRPWLRG